MEASAMLLLEREHRVHDTDSLLHEFFLVFHKSSVIRIHQLIAYVKSQEVVLGFVQNVTHEKKQLRTRSWFLNCCWLGYPDSNQERQDQNLQCYHYTISQCFSTAKLEHFS